MISSVKTYKVQLGGGRLKGVWNVQSAAEAGYQYSDLQYITCQNM